MSRLELFRGPGRLTLSERIRFVRNTFVPMMVLITTAALAGCDQQASQNAAQAQLEAAMDEIRAAEIGYVPVADTQQSVWAYRDAALDKATPALRNVLQSGSPEQKVVAARQLAMIDLSGARYQAREALAVNAEIAAQSASLLRHADAVAKAASLAQNLSVDGTAAIGKLETQIGEIEKGIAENEKQADALREKIGEHRASAEKVLSESRDMQSRAAEAQAQAFVAEDDEHFDALDLAAKHQRDAQMASTRADKENNQTDELLRELTIVQTDIDGGNEAIKSLKQRIAAIMDRDASVNEDRGIAEEQLAQLVETLMEQFRQVDVRFTNELQAPLDSARQRVDAAMTLLDQAKSMARGVETNAVTGDQLTAFSDKSYLLIEQAAATNSHAEVLGTLNGVADALPPASAGQIRDAYERTVAKRDQLVSEAEVAVGEAKTIAGNLSDDAATSQSEQLGVFEDRVAKLKQ